jgi:hypothetical protein
MAQPSWFYVDVEQHPFELVELPDYGEAWGTTVFNPLPMPAETSRSWTFQERALEYSLFAGWR